MKLRSVTLCLLFMISFVSLCLYAGSIWQMDMFQIKSESQTEIIVVEKQRMNPFLRSSECLNAVINKDNIEITESIKASASKCPGFNGVYTRESLSAFMSGMCPYKHQSVRTHSLLHSYLKHNNNHLVGNNADWNDWFQVFPIYYMIPKSGSSTIHKILSIANKYRDKGSVSGERLSHFDAIRGSKCAFTVVRSPIDRIISGYYTINVHLWRFLQGSFSNLQNETIRKPATIWKYMTIKGEPQRFKMFVNELINEPNRFTTSSGNEHVASASLFLSYHFGLFQQSDLHFIGKIENFTASMLQLINVCNEYFNGSVENTYNRIVNNDHNAHEMKGFGWGAPWSWVEEWHKYSNWVDWMSLKPILSHWKLTKNVTNILPPAYYSIDESTYDQIVRYYVQDLVCFDYKHSWQHFKMKRDSHLNIYQMYN